MHKFGSESLGCDFRDQFDMLTNLLRLSQTPRTWCTFASTWISAYALEITELLVRPAVEQLIEA
jgi:hypothetical protein